MAEWRMGMTERDTCPSLRWLMRVGLILLAVASGVASAAEESGEAMPALGVEGITAHSADDDPGVLYILPWQPPTLPKRPRARLEDHAPELLEPLDPLALERHRVFRQTLNPSMDSYLSVQ